MSLEHRIASAEGLIPADLVIKNARIVSVTSGRIIENDIGISDGVIIGIGRYKSARTIDVDGAYVSSGFIDAHMHIESVMVSPEEFARTVVPMGTTSIFIDPHEITNVHGVKGIEYILHATEGLPLTVFVLLPSCVPATELETSGGSVTAKDLEPFWGKPRVIGLAEVMNFPAVIARKKWVLDIIRRAKGNTIDGHAPGLTKLPLNAYLMANIRSDHESTTAKEAMVKLSAGLHLMIREGTCERNLRDLLPVVKKGNAHRCMFASDDKSPADILKEGHINYIIKKAVRLGLNPVTAIQMATLNTAEYFRLRRKLGAVAVGHKADIVVFDNFRDLNIKMVFKKGELVAKDGKMVVPVRSKYSPRLVNSMKVKRLSLRPFEIAAPAEKCKIRVIELVPNQIVTKEAVRCAATADGRIIANAKRDIAKLVVVERHKMTGNVGVGFVKGLGISRGAIASTVAHDSHNIIVAGMNDRDMFAAVKAVIRAGGGMAVVDEGRVLALLKLPIAGLMSDRPIKEVAKAKKRLISFCRRLGSKLPDPFQSLSFLALPVIPELKLTDKGLVDVSRQRIVPLNYL